MSPDPVDGRAMPAVRKPICGDRRVTRDIKTVATEPPRDVYLAEPPLDEETARMNAAVRRLEQILADPGPNIKVRRLPTEGRDTVTPIPLPVLVNRMFRELAAKKSAFHLQRFKFARGVAGRDMSTSIFGHKASTPFGPR